MSPKVFVLFALVASTVSFPQNGYGAPPAPASQNGYGAPAAPEVPAKYNFDWSVKDDESGNDFGHTEERDGDNTEGSYFVVLPDGRTQRVTYYVNGDSGFVAEVEYEEPKGAAAAPRRPSYGYQ